jgi:hypothetical protein
MLILIIIFSIFFLCQIPFLSMHTNAKPAYNHTQQQLQLARWHVSVKLAYGTPRGKEVAINDSDPE